MGERVGFVVVADLETQFDLGTSQTVKIGSNPATCHPPP
jgi:hypothetical protein